MLHRSIIVTDKFLVRYDPRFLFVLFGTPPQGQLKWTLVCSNEKQR
jgi:hypothetical protein